LVFDRQGNQTHRYLYGTGIDQVLADETPNGVTWALADHQGIVKDLLDGNGAIVSHISYDSFGRVISNTGNIDFRYGYTGREADSETGLDYYRARYYDSAVGGFISEDPIGFSAGDRNLRRYVGNSPTNFVDPSGLQQSPVADDPNPWLPILVTGLTLAPGPLKLVVGVGVVGVGIVKGLNDLSNSFPKTRGEDLSQPILSFPDPNRDRFGLGSPPRTGTPDVPYGIPGFDLGSPLPPITNTGHPRAEDLSLPFLEANHGNTRKNAAELRRNMENAGEVFNPGDAAHHIAPSTDGRTQSAIQLRNTLGSHGIDVNDANNGVRLPKSQHDGQGLHRGATYQSINDRLSEANNRSEAEAILRDIAAEMQAGTFP
jgi:RHS repeat-associated protein